MSIRTALIVLGIVLPVVGRAQSPGAPPLVTGRIGALALNLPAYPGSDERWTIPVPFVDLRLARRLYVGDGLGGLSAGAGVYLVEAGGFSWSADLALTSDRPEDRADALAGMGDRGFGAFAGSTIGYRLGAVEAFATAGVGLEGRMGALGVLGLSVGQRVGERWFVQAGGGAVFGDCANLRWEFGVSEAQAARRRELLESGAPGLRPSDAVAYTPRCGLRELRATGSLGYALTPRISTFASAAGVRLEGGAAESPLTRVRNGWEAGVGLAWQF